MWQKDVVRALVESWGWLRSMVLRCKQSKKSIVNYVIIFKMTKKLQYCYYVIPTPMSTTPFVSCWSNMLQISNHLHTLLVVNHVVSRSYGHKYFSLSIIDYIHECCYRLVKIPQLGNHVTVQLLKIFWI